MGLSTGKDLHIDQHLTNLAINYRPQGLIADAIAPIIPVQKQSDAYPVFSRFEAFAIEDTVRAPRTEAKKITRSVSSGQYQAKNHALGYDVPIEDVANMDNALRFELDAGASAFLQNKFGMAWEKRVLDMAVNTTNVGSVFVMNSSWAATGTNGGDAITAVFQLLEHARTRTGQKMNSLWFGWRAWNYFSRNYHVRNFLNGVNNGKGLVTRDMAKGLFEVDRLLVSEAMYHTHNEAMTDAFSLQSPMENQLIAYFAPTAPSRDDPSWMYSFRWQAPGLPAPLTVFRHPYDTKKRVETIEIDLYQDEKIVGTDYAYRLITNAASGSAGLGI
jgi:hypothetical protein